MSVVDDVAKYAELQLAAEAYFSFPIGIDGLQDALLFGNSRVSRLTETQAADFVTHYQVLDRISTKSGFSGTLFEDRQTHERILSFRSTEFVDDAVRDNLATNTLEIKDKGWAFGQVDDMKQWVDTLYASGKLSSSQKPTVTGYSLGGHLATVFNLLRREERTNLNEVVTFNGAGVGTWYTQTLGAVFQQFNTLKAVGLNESAAAHVGITDTQLATLYDRVRATVNSGQGAAAADVQRLQDWVAYSQKDGAGNALAVQIGKQPQSLTRIKFAGETV
jgi:pimeloyl-ACP methyl ester carboxylesterase